MKEETIQRIRKFTADRDWDKYHTPNALAKTIAIEATELLECFQWNNEYDLESLTDEIADVYVYLLDLCNKIGVDLVEITEKKMDKNELKYPVDKAKGNSKKYTQFKK